MGFPPGIAYGLIFHHWGTLWPTIVMALSFNLALFGLFQSGVLAKVALLSDRALELLLILLAAALLVAELLRPAAATASGRAANR